VVGVGEVVAIGRQ